MCGGIRHRRGGGGSKEFHIIVLKEIKKILFRGYLTDISLIAVNICFLYIGPT